MVACFCRELGLHSSASHGNKISTTFSLSARGPQESGKPWTEIELEWVSVNGCVVDRVRTWFCHIGERFADGSQTKHVLGLHFKVVPERKQSKTQGLKGKCRDWKCHSAIEAEQRWGKRQRLKQNTGLAVVRSIYVSMKPKSAMQLRRCLARVESGRKKGAAGGKLKFRRALINARKAMMEEESGGMYAWGMSARASGAKSWLELCSGIGAVADGGSN